MTTASRSTQVTDISEFIDDSPWLGDYAVFNMMMYSEPGEGKTPILGTVVDCERLMPALLVDCDSGTLSIKGVKGLNTLHLHDVAARLSVKERRVVTPWGALEGVYNWLRVGKHEYKTVMLDGGTDIERACEIDSISWGIENREKHDIELASLEDFRRIQNRMKRMYMRFRDLKTIDGRRLNVVATAHEGKRKDENTGRVEIQPLFIGKGAPMMASVFDIVGRLIRTSVNGKDDVLCLVCKVHEKGKARGRDRSGGFKNGIVENPTMTKIAEAIWGKEKNS